MPYIPFISLEFSNRRTSGHAGKIVQGCKPFTLILQLCSCGKIVASISTDLTPFVVTAMAKPDPEKSDFKAMGMAPGRDFWESESDALGRWENLGTCGKFLGEDFKSSTVVPLNIIEPYGSR